jgi:hypothetical protein
VIVNEENIGSDSTALCLPCKEKENVPRRANLGDVSSKRKGSAEAITNWMPKKNKRHGNSAKKK